MKIRNFRLLVVFIVIITIIYNHPQARAVPSGNRASH